MTRNKFMPSVKWKLLLCLCWVWLADMSGTDTLVLVRQIDHVVTDAWWEMTLLCNASTGPLLWQLNRGRHCPVWKDGSRLLHPISLLRLNQLEEVSVPSTGQEWHCAMYSMLSFHPCFYTSLWSTLIGPELRFAPLVTWLRSLAASNPPIGCPKIALFPEQPAAKPSLATALGWIHFEYELISFCHFSMTVLSSGFIIRFFFWPWHCSTKCSDIPAFDLQTSTPLLCISSTETHTVFGFSADVVQLSLFFRRFRG